ncbi:DUF777 family protein (plasmid) [Borreliella carolinensis]|nr:DUF777 family protein [Borreliella carolinensis]WKC90399.2 DUF777 family protein [Borreliella carolinensis]WNY63378.1 DUF777 family protein [Borreliella carolinensis]WNY68226.1 DUF777 family protein [Borreliella carolinensis]
MRIKKESIMQNNDLCVGSGSLKGSAVGTVKQYLFENVFICRIGVIKSFDFKTQTGVVTIKEYEGLKINTCSISNFNLDLAAEDEVVLLQSNFNIFQESDNNHFDKNYFYILSVLNPKKIGIKLDQFKLSVQDFDSQSENIKFKAKKLIIDVDNIEIKGNLKINGTKFENHTHSSGTLTYVNSSGAPTTTTGKTGPIS